MNDEPAPKGPDEGRAQCTACSGTGQVISNLGGSPSTVPCPWCDGTGRFIPGHDAQAARREPEPESPASERPDRSA